MRDACAFPMIESSEEEVISEGSKRTFNTSSDLGLTKEEYFIGQALAGLAADGEYHHDNIPTLAVDLGKRVCDILYGSK